MALNVVGMMSLFLVCGWFAVVAQPGDVTVIPIEHASLVLKAEGKVVFVDPAYRSEEFSKQGKPDLVLMTDIHPDHLNVGILKELVGQQSVIVAPSSVYAELPEELQKQTVVMTNGDKKTLTGWGIEALPMYNLREEARKIHPKGRGNGYVITVSDQRIYISGDTEDIPEMRQLKNIDLAFVCMNLPYTMPVEKAAEAVLAFQPKVVYPYHYRGANGMSDVKKFKELVQQKNANINVVLAEWYRTK